MLCGTPSYESQMHYLTILKKLYSKSWMTIMKVHGSHGCGATPSWV
jgi:hypothetical protein